MHPRFLCERVRRRCRLPVLEGDSHSRTGDLFADIGLRCRNAGGEHGQTPRSVEIGHRVLGVQPFTVEKRVHAFAEFLRRGIDHPRWNLFASDLE